MASISDSVQSRARAYVSDERFHRRFTLPATATHDDLIVSYADIGRKPEPPSRGPTVLFMPGMFASRYLGLAMNMHAIAEKLGVRVLIVDRPGMGHSADVPLEQRLPVWLETVPRLLAHLGIEHVALMSHSAGTIYLLNTLHHCRDLLDPDRPSATLFAPWVDPKHSCVTSMQMAQYVPARVFGMWDQITSFYLLKAAPAFASSGAVATKFSSAISSGAIGGGNSDDTELEKNRRRIERDYGLSRDLQIEVNQLVMKSMLGENTVGANSEALQCLRKGPSGIWGKCEDYGVFVRDLADLERQRRGDQSDSHSGNRLKVRMYFAETDAMIGKTGQSYMEGCWTGKDGEFEDVLDLKTTTIAGTDHDTVVQSVETLETALLDIGGSVDGSAS